MKPYQTTLLVLVLLSKAMIPALAQEASEQREYNAEVRAPFNYQIPTEGDKALSFGGEFFYYLTPRIHSERYRSLFAEEVSRNSSMAHLAINYEPRSDLRTGTKGYTVLLEGVNSLGGKWGVGAVARYSSSDLELDAPSNDFELGPQVSYWSGNRTHFNEKITYRSISGVLNPLNPLNNPLIDLRPGQELERDEYIQLKHHLAYAIGEDWGFTYAHDVRVLVGILGTPHANNLNFYNYFIFSPSQSFSMGPVVGVNLDYFVGRATSALSIPLGGRFEFFTGPLAAEAEASYTINTMSGQKSEGWLVRGHVGYRF